MRAGNWDTQSWAMVDAARDAAFASFVKEARPASADTRDGPEQTAAIHLHNLLDEAEIASVIASAHAMAEDYDGKSFEDLLVAYGDAHAALHMHRDGYFARSRPALNGKLVSQMRMQSASRPGSWGSPMLPLSVRCVEFHAYTVGAALMDPGHRDRGSTISMSVLLSDPTKHDGGRFVTWEGAAPVVHELGIGDAILFPSEKVHNVSPLTRGVRNSLVIELWAGDGNMLHRYA